ncbi:MAG: hypothetical protein KDC46_08665 [Thermoleophilia bacterium]|nr:hypothetical protein [Thermoleophilia bacterium]
MGPDTAAARELVRVGDAAARKPWRALGEGEYFHLYASSVPGDDQTIGGPSGYEVWLDDEGHGQVLNVMGSADPSRLPTITPGGGIGTSTAAPKGRTVTLEESLTKPDSVNLMGWSADGTGFQRSWARQKDGFVKSYDSADQTDPSADSVSTSSGEQNMQQFWSLTAGQIDQLPDEGGAVMDEAIQALLDELLDESPMRTNRIPTGAWGITADQLDREDQIEFAANILASAPLPPEARRSLFRWLAMQPGATLERDAVDALDRPGVRITFEHKFKKNLPARTVTIQQLLDDAIAGGADIDADARITFMDFPKTNAEMERRQNEDFEKSLPRDRTYRIPAHSEDRVWTVEMIIDPDTGELLQKRSKMLKHSSAQIPELIRHKDRIQVNQAGGRGTSEGSGGSSLYFARNIARLDDAESPVCKSEPQLCRG